VELIINVTNSRSMIRQCTKTKRFSLQRSAKIAEHRAARNCLAAGYAIVPAGLALGLRRFRGLRSRSGGWHFLEISSQAVFPYVPMQTFLDVGVAYC
jgi:hypothetical protein